HTHAALARAAQGAPVGRAERFHGKARAPLRQHHELMLCGMATAHRSACERCGDDQPVEIERVQLVATVLHRGGGGEPESLARADDLCPRTGEPRYGAT